MPPRPMSLWPVKAGTGGTQAPLVDIINLSLGSGVYLEGLKEAVVVPLWKHQLVVVLFTHLLLHFSIRKLNYCSFHGMQCFFIIG